jgi:hypothetical protein
MVKEWDKTKQDGVGSQRSMRKKKAKDSGTPDGTFTYEGCIVGSAGWLINGGPFHSFF